MRRSKDRTYMCQAGKAQKAAFWLGAVDRVMRSTLVNVICAVLGFMIGIGSTVLTLHAHNKQSKSQDGLDGLIRLVGERRALDMRIEKCFEESVLKQLGGKGGILVWDGRSFHVEEAGSHKR